MTGKLLEEIIVVNFPNLVEEADIQVEEVQTISNKMNPEIHTKICYDLNIKS